MGMNLSKPQEMLKDRETWRAAVHGSKRVGFGWVTNNSNNTSVVTYSWVPVCAQLEPRGGPAVPTAIVLRQSMAPPSPLLDLALIVASLLSIWLLRIPRQGRDEGRMTCVIIPREAGPPSILLVGQIQDLGSTRFRAQGSTILELQRAGKCLRTHNSYP